MIGYVFGYGSLAHPADWALRDLPAATLYGFLQDHRRTWDVAFDNSSSLYDHKHYLDRSGKRLDSCISALGLYRSKGDRCNGLAIPVTTESLRLIDTRERSYNRVDVSDFWETDLSLPLWTYYPRQENKEIYQAALGSNRVILPRQYFDICQDAFRRWNGAEEFHQSTDSPTCPIEDAEFWCQSGTV